MTDPVITRQVDTFFASYPSREYKKGEVFIRGGDDPKGIYYLKEGHVRQYVFTKEGEEITLNMYKPGAFFPMSWAVNDYQNLYYFETMDASWMSLAPKDDVVEFVREKPEVLFDLLQRVYVGLDGILSRMEHLMSGKASQRLITILLISAKRFGKQQQDGILISLKLTHQDLANLAGLSRETVSREMIQLKQLNLIDYTNTSITITSLEALEKRLT